MTWILKCSCISLTAYFQDKFKASSSESLCPHEPEHSRRQEIRLQRNAGGWDLQTNGA